MSLPFDPELFSLASLEEAPPIVATTYASSSLEFIEGVHRARSESLKAVIADQGWPSAALMGEDVEAVAFKIAHYSDYDLVFQQLCHELMLASALRGQTKPGFLAYLTDRILCNMGKHQRFGTQIREVANGCFVPKAIEDSDKVDELRAAAGLDENLSEYITRINNGDLLLYRPLLGDEADDHELKTQTGQILPFPGQKPS